MLQGLYIVFSPKEDNIANKNHTFNTLTILFIVCKHSDGYFIDLDNIFSVLNVLPSSEQYFKRVNFVGTVLKV